MDELRMHGTWWEYSQSEEVWNAEDLSLVKPDGSDNGPLLKAIVRPYVAMLAGREAVFTFESESGEAFLEYAPLHGGITEVVIPARTFPKGAVVRGTGFCTASVEGRVLLQSSGDTKVLKQLDHGWQR